MQTLVSGLDHFPQQVLLVPASVWAECCRRTVRNYVQAHAGGRKQFVDDSMTPGDSRRAPESSATKWLGWQGFIYSLIHQQECAAGAGALVGQTDSWRSTTWAFWDWIGLHLVDLGRAE